MKSNAQAVNNTGPTLVYRVLKFDETVRRFDIVRLGNSKTTFVILTITRRSLNLQTETKGRGDSHHS